MSQEPQQAEFFGKTWFFHAQAVIFAALTLFALILGPLFLTGAVRPAHGGPGTTAGIALSVMAAPLLAISMLAWFNIAARQKPLLKVYREGLEVNVIGASSLDRHDLIPTWIRVAWLVVSRQGFKRQIAWIPWETLRKIEVIGPRMMQTLMIDATVLYPTFTPTDVRAVVAASIAFGEAEFSVPLEQVKLAIQSFVSDPESRDLLPSLFDED